MNEYYEPIGDIIIDKKQVYKFLGYGSCKPKAIIEKKTVEEIEVFKTYIADIRVYYKALNIINTNIDTVFFDSVFKLQSKHLAESLNNCTRAYIVFTTLGHKIDDRIRHYYDHFDTIRSLILDKISIVGMDDINRQFKNWVNKKESPYVISTEIFTGEKDFGTENTNILLNIFNNIDININKYNILNPIKTVVYILGIGKQNNQIDKCLKCKNPCK